MIFNPVVTSGGASGLVTAIIKSDRSSYKIIGYPGESVCVLAEMQKYTYAVTGYTAVDGDGNAVTLPNFISGRDVSNSNSSYPAIILQFDMPDVDVTVTLKGAQG